MISQTIVKKRDSFIFYRSFFEASKSLNDIEKAQLFDAICVYVFEERMPELSGVVAGFFTLIQPQIDANNKKRLNGMKGAEHGAKGGEHGAKGGRPVMDSVIRNFNKTPQKPPKNPPENPPNVNVNVNVNDNVELLSNSNELSNNSKKENINPSDLLKEKPRFTAPSLDEVKNYCTERKNSVDAENWLNHYISNGWMVGKNKMKDWKAAVRTWERSNFLPNQTYQNPRPQAFKSRVERVRDVFAEFVKDQEERDAS